MRLLLTAVIPLRATFPGRVEAASAVTMVFSGELSGSAAAGCRTAMVRANAPMNHLVNLFFFIEIAPFLKFDLLFVLIIPVVSIVLSLPCGLVFSAQSGISGIPFAFFCISCACHLFRAA